MKKSHGRKGTTAKSSQFRDLAPAKPELVTGGLSDVQAHFQQTLQQLTNPAPDPPVLQHERPHRS
jgi:hypothetical protein